jgi:hypothetical protein
LQISCSHYQEHFGATQDHKIFTATQWIIGDLSDGLPVSLNMLDCPTKFSSREP